MNKQEIRRAVIREWMALPRDKRETEEQTAGFAVKAVQRYELPRSRVTGKRCSVAAQGTVPGHVYQPLVQSCHGNTFVSPGSAAPRSSN